MHVTQRLLRLILAIGFACVVAEVAVAQYLKSEPPLGSLKPGQRVLVDDGKCPKGKIKEVIGGDHVKVGGKSQVKRIRRCIPRP
jgi:hypothetical protein